MSGADGFQIGDRVRLRAETVDSWRDQKVNLRAKKGIPATVESVVGTKLPANERYYSIKFDTVGRTPAMHQAGVAPRYLERIPE